MKRFVLKTLYFIVNRLIGIIKPISLGVRVLLIQEGKALMVKHVYQDEWFLVGGGVKRHETLEEAARREAMEEAGATLGKLTFVGMYTNYIHLRTDYIATFLCENFTYTGEHDFEIEEIRLFPLDELPEKMTAGIHRRLTAYKEGEKPGDFGMW